MMGDGVLKNPRPPKASFAGTRYSRVKCDECGHAFRPQPYERDHGEGEGDGIRIYLQCPKCTRAYPSADITQEGVRLRKKLSLMRSQGRAKTPKYARVLERYQAEVTRLGQSAGA